MNPKTREYKAAFDKIHLILIKEWDPIGVGNEPYAQDEYDSYIPAIYRLLSEGADEHKLTKHLEQLATVSMGLSSGTDHDALIARRLREVLGDSST